MPAESGCGVRGAGSTMFGACWPHELRQRFIVAVTLAALVPSNFHIVTDNYCYVLYVLTSVCFGCNRYGNSISGRLHWTRNRIDSRWVI